MSTPPKLLKLKPAKIRTPAFQTETIRCWVKATEQGLVTGEASGLDVPVLPVTISYTYRVLRDGTRIVHRASVQIDPDYSLSELFTQVVFTA